MKQVPPYLTVVLVGIWLLLNGELSVMSIAFGQDGFILTIGIRDD